MRASVEDRGALAADQESHPARNHVFVSYARADGADAAKDIQRKLEEAQIRCWRDRHDLESSEDFWRQIERGIALARYLLIVLTPGALASAWTRKEWRFARHKGIPVCPVWFGERSTLAQLLSASTLPNSMRNEHIFTLKLGNDWDPGEWESLLANLRVRRDLRPVPAMAPEPPSHYVPRPTEVAAIVNALLDPDHRLPVAITTALRGAGGFGKTTLARAVAWNEDIKDAFKDGILWVELGSRPNLLNIISD